MYQIVPDTIATVDVPEKVRGPGGKVKALRSRSGSIHLKPGTLDRVTDHEYAAIKSAGIMLRSAVQEYADGKEQKPKPKPGNREKSVTVDKGGIFFKTGLKAPVPAKVPPKKPVKKSPPPVKAGAKKVEVKKPTTSKKAPKTRKVKKT